ncbi:N-acetyllactosaminide beta-1,3-N-acetylglucosaminyltransferase 2 [Sphaeramia orbicularis]|uniref:Hexosyltransferase n=1 Tax=Sphaeramia orbicularis TaxID=375764 RepID=A0A673C1Q0_9TELE|nr:N-acetyllactosaminide beta-1,3-N-acetylglucosaminyltransferase 2-like [Sphaeramia orbicularis]
MARCFCRWRSVVICICTPCICMFLFFMYVGILVTMKMQPDTSGTPSVIVSKPLPRHFVASGLTRSNSSAPLPVTFWDIDKKQDALWNLLQFKVDSHFNPILNPYITKQRHASDISESVLMQSFLEVSDPENVMHNVSKLPQQLQDFVRYMNKREYPVIIEPNGVCGAGAKHEKEPPLLLMAIKSTELNFKNRQAIRQTWGQAGWVAGQNRVRDDGGEGKRGAYVRRVFLLAKESIDELGVDVSQLLLLESQRYGDILQWDFKETFFNLTLKDVLFWDWFNHHCKQIQFIFKGDDDVFVNSPVMINYLLDQLRKPQKHAAIMDFMVGEVIGAAKPNNINTSKYFIPKTFYKGLYPIYAGGGGVVYSGILARRLHNISKRVHLFPIDDVYVGMCMIRLNAAPIHHPAFLTFDFPKKEEKEQCAYHKILLVHKRSPAELVHLWTERKRTEAQCWNVTLRVDKKQKTKTLIK